MPAQRIEFHPLPFVSSRRTPDPYGGGRLADMIRQRGYQQSEAQLRQGEIQQRMWAQVGQSIGEAAGMYQSQQEAERKRKIEQKAREQQEAANAITLESGRIDLEEKKRSKKGRELMGALTPFTLQQTADGIFTYDRNTIAREFQASNLGDALPEIFAGLDQADSAATKMRAAKRELAQEAVIGSMRAVEASGYSPQAMRLAADHGVSNGLWSQEEADEIIKSVGNDPKRVRQAVMAIRGDKPKDLMSVAPGATVFDPGSQEALYTAPAKPEEGPAVGSFEDFVVRQYGPNPSPQDITEARKTYMQADDRAPRITVRTGSGEAQAREAMPPLYAHAIERVLPKNIGKSRVDAIMQDAAAYLAEGNEEGLKNRLKQVAIDFENVDTKNQIQGRQRTQAQLASARDVLNSMKERGVPTNWFVGTFEDLARKVGATQNPEYVALTNQLMNTLIELRRSATGVQFGEREAAQYQQMIPNPKNLHKVNLALLDGLEKSMQITEHAYWQHKFGKEAAETLGFVPPSQPSQPEQPRAPAPGGRGGAAPPQGGAPVQMITPPSPGYPNGRKVMVPADKVEEAKRRGAKVAGG